MSTLRQIRRLPNTRDRSGAEIARIESAALRCIEALSLRGYERLQTPLIEETELFLRKSGGELSSRLYDFDEPGGFRTSIRPEFTSPVIRYAIESGEAASKTCRYQYFGPVFRYASPEHPDGAKTREFNQLGAELIGVPPARADGEVIAMAVEGLSRLGVPPVRIVLGHVGLLRSLMQKFQLSERAGQFLLSRANRIAAGALEDVRTEARRLGLLVSNGATVEDSPSERKQIEAALQRSLGPLGANAGSRTREEVVARLARKQTHADDPARFESAISMLGELTSISGNAAASLDSGRKLAAGSRLDEKCFGLLESVVEAAIDEGVPSDTLEVRFGLARGVAYYTGMVFDLLPTEDAEDSLGGGGRYDGLTRALGLDVDVPALGFAYYFDGVMELLANTEPDSREEPVLVSPADDSAWRAAAEVAVEMRSGGKAVVLDTGGNGSAEGFSERVVVDAAGRRVARGDDA